MKSPPKREGALHNCGSAIAQHEFEGSDNVAEINALHNEIVDLGETALEKAIRIGDLLVANKKAVPHGAWLDWIDENLDFGCRQAQNYMTMYERRGELPNTQSIAHLGIEGCLDVLRKIDREATRANGEQPATVAIDSKLKPDGTVHKPACERKIDKRSKQKPKSLGPVLKFRPEDDDPVLNFINRLVNHCGAGDDLIWRWSRDL